jgi:transcriptional regulator with XRE-family HTH domain
MTQEEKQSLLGARLRELRKRNDLTLGDLERASGVSKGYLSQLEGGGAKNPGIDAVTKIARALGVPISELLGESPAEGQSQDRLPAGLKGFLDEAAAQGAEVTDEDVKMLLGIRYRGRQPRTAEDWKLLYDLIKRIIVR